MLRSEVSHGTEYGQKVKEVLSKGGLVDDELMLALIQSNLEKLVPLICVN